MAAGRWRTTRAQQSRAQFNCQVLTFPTGRGRGHLDFLVRGADTTPRRNASPRVPSCIAAGASIPPTVVHSSTYPFDEIARRRRRKRCGPGGRGRCVEQSRRRFNDRDETASPHRRQAHCPGRHRRGLRLVRSGRGVGHGGPAGSRSLRSHRRDGPCRREHDPMGNLGSGMGLRSPAPVSLRLLLPSSVRGLLDSRPIHCSLWTPRLGAAASRRDHEHPYAVFSVRHRQTNRRLAGRVRRGLRVRRSSHRARVCQLRQSRSHGDVWRDAFLLGPRRMDGDAQDAFSGGQLGRRCVRYVGRLAWISGGGHVLGVEPGARLRFAGALDDRGTRSFLRPLVVAVDGRHGSHAVSYRRAL
jgi:hypothetical protein